MDRKIVDYQICFEDNIVNLEMKVKRYTQSNNNDWEPFGSLQIYTDEHGDIRFIQPVVMYKD